MGQPAVDNMAWKLLFELGSAGRAKIYEQLRPWLESFSLDDSMDDSFVPSPALLSVAIEN